MNILITGGSGMVGKNLINYLSENTKYNLFYPTSLELNLLEYDKILKFIKKNKIESIVHCAGLVGGIQANIERPFSFLNINFQIGANVINAALNLGINKLINLGSSCMYPKDHDGELHEKDILSGSLESTNEGYALAKISIAKMCEFGAKEYGFNYKTIIPCNLYGKWDKFDPKNSHMIPAVIRKLNLAKNKNDSAIIWGDGTARREFMYAEDLADFILFVINNYEDIDLYTNVGLGYDYSILDYYNKIAKVVGYSGEFTFDLSKPIGMKRKLCSVEKQNKLDWSPKHSLESGLLKTYKFYLENYGI